MRKLLPLYLAWSCLASAQAPIQERSKVQVTVINKSRHNFQFVGYRKSYPTNELFFNGTEIPPGENGTIVGSTSYSFDLAGSVVFGSNAYFRIIDRRIFHFGQAVFEMMWNFTSSRVLSKTANPNPHPKALQYTEAVVEVTDWESN